MPTPDWPFDQTSDTAGITTRQVLDDKKPILNVGHDEEDDSWTFVCGTTDHIEHARVVSMESILTLDPTLRTIADLPPGCGARREEVGGEWVRFVVEE